MFDKNHTASLDSLMLMALVLFMKEYINELNATEIKKIENKIKALEEKTK